jgi:putative NIF3 family GTP cyclohydrolase 1 type 2
MISMKKTHSSQIVEFVESLSGHPLNRDEGILYGEQVPEVGTVTVCWMATPGAIDFAGEQGADLLLGHEALFYPYPFGASPLPSGWEMWPVNRARRELLDRHDLPFLRIHGSADEICILDDFADLLDLGQPVSADRLVKVYEIEPVRLSELTHRVKKKTGMKGLRVAAEDDTVVHRVGLPWGGLGLFVNVGYQQSLIALGCDVFIAGESDNYGFRFAQEAGVPMIETSHEVSENPGLRHFTQILQKQFPSIRFTFFENPCCWRME